MFWKGFFKWFGIYLALTIVVYGLLFAIVLLVHHK